MNITLYTTHCPQCLVLEEKLKDKDIEFNEIDDTDLMISLGMMSAPTLEVDGERMDFATANKWVNNYEAEG